MQSDPEAAMMTHSGLPRPWGRAGVHLSHLVCEVVRSASLSMFKGGASAFEGLSERGGGWGVGAGLRHSKQDKEALGTDLTPLFPKPLAALRSQAAGGISFPLLLEETRRGKIQMRRQPIK